MEEKQLKYAINSKALDAPCAAYSQGIISTGMRRLYLSSVAPYLADWELPVNIKSQTTILIEGIEKMLIENNFTLDDIVKVTVYLKSVEDRTIFNQIYSQLMPQPWPARSVLIIPEQTDLIEMELIAEN